MSERIYFGSIKEGIEPPNLIEVQANSYVDFLQKDVPYSKRKNQGLQAVFKEVFPIESYDEKAVLDFSHYDIGEPKLTPLEAQREGQTYSAPLHVTFQLREEKGTKEEKVYMGEIPLMTPQGTFVINGAERVVVSQLHRSPGIAFESTVHVNGKVLYSFRIIPDRGSWIEVQFDTADLLYIYLDRRKRRRKFLATTFLRALGYGSDEEVIKLFYNIETLKLSEKLDEEKLATKVLTAEIRDGDVTVARAFEPLTLATVRQIMALKIHEVKVIDISNDDTVVKALRKDPAHDQEEALKDIYRRLRPGDPPTVANARALLKRLFFDPKKYDLGRVGRYKINQKLGINVDSTERILTDKDFIAAIKYLINLRRGEGTLDDIDHLGSRRVRTVGELLANQCRVGLARTERLVKERMTLFDINVDGMTPQKLINPKALSAVIRDFFGRSQLSQFMDQTNPLAELTHKRRLSALGPGVLSRERAGFEVRDVHPSHYGRICPIETPEGPNIGLIASLATFARINDFGFLETPYRKVDHGKVTSHIDYLTADREEQYTVAQANSPVKDSGQFSTDRVVCRGKGDFIDVEPAHVDYMDVSPKQLVSVAASLIPFLDPEKGIYVYQVRKFMRSNAATCINQKILVKKGESVKKGQVIADGPCTQGGELALGRNVLVAFMPWNGYNFEDAILISERIVKEDIFTSIHIDEFEVGARDTKLGPEEITRDIPNLGDEALKNLGPDGVIRVGAEVKPGDILVGKITPKSETELAPEERLLRAIFGEKAADVKDTSLKVPSGTYGIVMDVKVSAKKESDRETRSAASEEKRHAKEVEDEYKKKTEELRDQLTEALSNILLGEKIPLDVVNSETGEIIIPANRKITKTLLRKLAQVYDRIEIDPSPIRNKINEIIGSFKKKFDDLQMQYDEEIERAESGEGVESGVVKSVKVYIASKRKLSVGDKMAGRHGNKGVVAKIVAEEDMPFPADGTPVDIGMTPPGVPSRMNVGQVLETHLGWAARLLGLQFSTSVFDGIKEKDIRGYLKEAGLPEHAKVKLTDGRTGEQFDQEIVVGYIYMMKLGHLVADKIHARAVGPYSLVTQQPLGGKAQYGGQRFGEMEVWAMEAYGAAYTLQELLTVKSDDVQGRTRIYESIVKGDNSLEAGTPESFNVLIKEMQSLGLDVKVGSQAPTFMESVA